MNLSRSFRIYNQSTICIGSKLKLKSKISVRLIHNKQYLQDEQFDLSKSFDSLDSSSFKTMENILQILHNAEEQVDTKKKKRKADFFAKNMIEPEANYQNDFSTEFGMDIFEYRIVKFFNNKNILHDYPNILKHFPSSYEELVVNIVNSYKNMENSFFKTPEATINGKLNNYQAISKLFIEEDSRCLKRLNIDVKFLLKNILRYSPTKRIYNFPILNLPPPKSYDTSNPLTIMKAFNMSNNRLNLLPFLIDDNLVIQKVILEHQTKTKSIPDTFAFIKTLMKSQEVEGGMIFSILTRKILYKENSLNADMIMSKFINNNNLKAIIAYQSKIPSRLLSFRKYKSSISNSSSLAILTDEQIITLLASHFNRFFAVFYSAAPLQCEQWLTELLKYYNTTILEEKKLLEESVTYFKDIISESTFDTIKSKWTN